MIALDLDGVICNLMAPVLHHIRQEYGAFVYENDIRYYRLEEVLGIPDAWGMVREAIESKEAPVYEGVREGLQRLLVEDSITIVTARPGFLADCTHEWLVEWGLNEYIGGVYFAQLGANDPIYSEDFTIAVDDRTEKLLRYRKTTKKFLFRRPWNQRCLNVEGNFTTVRSWQRLVEEIMLAAQH